MESSDEKLKEGSQARVIWADSTKKEKTPYVFLYVHGYSASPMEGDPVHREIAKAFGANLLLERTYDHGHRSDTEVFLDATADKFWESAENYFQLAKRLGDTVVVMGTSFGGAMTLELAARHPEIKAIALFSPCVAINNPASSLLDDPWGLQIGRMVSGGDYNNIPPKNEEHDKYWNLRYRLEGVVALQNFLTHTMLPETFEKIKCPVYLGYYYKDEENQDKVVSVPAMLSMFEDLGTENKEKVAFPDAANHVITSPILGENVELVSESTIEFLNKFLIH
jgi:esterase/lipase